MLTNESPFSSGEAHSTPARQTKVPWQTNWAVHTHDLLISAYAQSAARASKTHTMTNKAHLVELIDAPVPVTAA